MNVNNVMNVKIVMNVSNGLSGCRMEMENTVKPCALLLRRI